MKTNTKLIFFITFNINDHFVIIKFNYHYISFLLYVSKFTSLTDLKYPNIFDTISSKENKNKRSCHNFRKFSILSRTQLLAIYASNLVSFLFSNSFSLIESAPIN